MEAEDARSLVTRWPAARRRALLWERCCTELLRGNATERRREQKGGKIIKSGGRCCRNFLEMFCQVYKVWIQERNSEYFDLWVWIWLDSESATLKCIHLIDIKNHVGFGEQFFHTYFTSSSFILPSWSYLILFLTIILSSYGFKF